MNQQYVDTCRYILFIDFAVAENRRSSVIIFFQSFHKTTAQHNSVERSSIQHSIKHRIKNCDVAKENHYCSFADKPQ